MIGVMQGRLSPPLSKKIQEFPWVSWEQEFIALSDIGVRLLEWTLDLERLNENPLMTSEGQIRILEAKRNYGISIESVTLDCFIEAPLHRTNPLNKLKSEVSVFENIIRNASQIGISIGVLPLVFESGADNESSLGPLFELLKELANECLQNKFNIALECEFQLPTLKWISNQIADLQHVGFNFDIGNSASLGNNPLEELSIYGGKLINVHIKDRLLGGKTVPLGTGNANYTLVSEGLRELNYNGNMILQAARGETGTEKEVISDYIEFCRSFGWDIN